MVIAEINTDPYVRFTYKQCSVKFAATMLFGAKITWI